MKKIILYSLLFTLSGMLNAVSGQSKSYVIEGNIAGATSISKIYFAEGSFQKSNPGPVREIPVKAGKYLITGKLDEPKPVWISLNSDLQKNAINFLVDEGKNKVESASDLSAEQISGSKIFSDLMAYRQSQSQLSNSQQIIAFQKKYIETHPNDFMSLLALSEFIGMSQDYLTADTLMKSLGAPVKATPTAKLFAGLISGQTKLSVGAVAPDFTQNNTEGKPINLFSLRGKYVLIDFWASWCGPCRRENPNVVAAYQQFKDKGFTILGVSLDRSKENWLKAIKDDGLTWIQVSDLQYWSNSVAQLYNVSSIPANFLLDQNGKIIAKDLRGEDLVAKLAELLR